MEDCLDPNSGMSRLPDKSVSMILCDPPYGSTRNKWDTVLPPQDLWSHYWRVLKDNGVVVLFGQDKFTATMMLSSEHHKYNLVWDKLLPSGHLNANKMPMRVHEDIMVFYRKPPTYTSQKFRGRGLNHTRGSDVGAVEEGNRNYNAYVGVDNREELGEMKHPRSILSYQKPHPSIALHATQKPVDLLKFLILSYTVPGDIVLDNCMGSGSTAIAALETGRPFIGFENNQEEGIYDVACERVRVYRETGEDSYRLPKPSQ